MPRWIDWDRSPVHEYEMDQKSFAPRYGTNELHSLGNKDLSCDYYRTSQFSTYASDHHHPDNKEFFEGVFNWLEENCKGAWHFGEGWCNHGHSVDLSVYIEQTPDQEKFKQSEWSKFLRFREPSHGDLVKTAIVLGFLQPYTVKESLQTWVDEARQSTYELSEDYGDDEDVIITFNNGTLETKFIEEWINHPDPQKRAAPADTSNAYIVKPWKERGDFSFSWLDEAVVSTKIERDGDSFVKFISLNCPELTESFERDWGYIYKKQQDGSYKGALLRSPERILPQAFLDYIDGKTDMSVALQYAPQMSLDVV